MKCVLVCGGEFCKDKFSLADDDVLVAVDKGYEYIKDFAKPHYAVGDFDSLGYVPQGITTICHDPVKDYTDTQLAIEYMISKGYDDFVIHAGLGGRLDHTLANLQMAYGYVRQGKKIKFIGKDQEIFFVNDKVAINGKKGTFFSVFSLDKSIGVSIKNAKYVISDMTLTNTYPLGVSNEFVDGECDISVKDGILMVVVNDENIR